VSRKPDAVQVKEILMELGGRIEGQKPFAKAIGERIGCSERSAVTYIGIALGRKVISEEPDPHNRKRKIYHA
jgi:hypothetical protein